jgi:GNAT superfamily N-acetyltransferase
VRHWFGLDSPYISRLLRSFEKQGLTRVTSENDKVGRGKLAEAGLRERAELDRGADSFAHPLPEPLSEIQPMKLEKATSQVERLQIASMVQITAADANSQDARWCFEQYFSELNERFDTGFDPTLSISAHAHELTPPAGRLLIAYLGEEPVGCGALKLHDNTIGELKRMWVAPRARGLGLGRRLLVALEESAREAGISKLAARIS